MPEISFGGQIRANLSCLEMSGVGWRYRHRCWTCQTAGASACRIACMVRRLHLSRPVDRFHRTRVARAERSLAVRHRPPVPPRNRSQLRCPRRRPPQIEHVAPLPRPARGGAGPHADRGRAAHRHAAARGGGQKVSGVAGRGVGGQGVEWSDTQLSAFRQ